MSDATNINKHAHQLLSIYHACKKGYIFEGCPDRYVLKDINNGFKIVSFDLIDHDVGLFEFIGFSSYSQQHFYSYVSQIDKKSKLWHEILGHLNFGKM